MAWYLCAAGETFRGQVDRRWPKRDKASDGDIGDDAHCPGPSDHCEASNGAVRAIDLDSNLAAGDPDAMYRLVNQLRRYCQYGHDNGRVSYIIYDGKIASGTYHSSFWKWRTYTGSDPHTNHSHISFTPKGDKLGGKFDLRIFTSDLARKRRRLRKALDDLAARIRALRAKREAKRRKLNQL